VLPQAGRQHLDQNSGEIGAHAGRVRADLQQGGQREPLRHRGDRAVEVLPDTPSEAALERRNVRTGIGRQIGRDELLPTARR